MDRRPAAPSLEPVIVFFQAEDGIRAGTVTGVQTCALPISYPWGGSSRRPNGGMYPGPVLYTDSLVVLDGATGALRWHDQVLPHDVRDYDLAATPRSEELRARKDVPIQSMQGDLTGARRRMR